LLLHLLVLASLSVAALWGWSLVSGEPIGESEKYILMASLYGAASAVFIFSRIQENRLTFFDIPVFLTILMFIEFGLAPLECLVEPSQLDYRFGGSAGPLIEAFLCVATGMAAFWTGCSVKLTKGRGEQAGQAGTGPPPVARSTMPVFEAAAALYAVACGAKLYMLTHHLYYYLASENVLFSSLPYIEVLNAAAGFGTYALVIACIESYARPADRKWKLFFAVVFASECFWGLISGMKAFLFQNFLIVALISSVLQRRFRKGWIIATVVGLITFYPLSNAYRAVIVGQGKQVTSLAAAVEVGAQALTTTGNGASGPLAELKSGWLNTVHRVDNLQSMGLVISLGARATQLTGRERMWMLPFYPFIPRFIWPSKPTLFEGRRFSVLLGYGTSVETAGTSTAVTYPGDLYVRGGLSGIIVGMLLLGIAAQWLTNSVAGALDKRRLFIYASIFFRATDMEVDAFGFWSNIIRAIAILSVVAWLIYGPQRPWTSLENPKLRRRHYAGGPQFRNEPLQTGDLILLQTHDQSPELGPKA
jgi:hypothetical protein